MGRSILDLYQLMSTGFGVLSMLIFVGGFSACMIYRKLSPMLWMVALGFAGLFVSNAIIRSATLILQGKNPDLLFLTYMIAGVLEVISNVILVAGLWFVLARIRRQIALSMEPDRG